MKPQQYRRIIENLPEKTRKEIQKCFSRAFSEINRAECLIMAGTYKSNHCIPILEDQYSLNSAVWTMEKIFDIENHPDENL